MIATNAPIVGAHHSNGKPKRVGSERAISRSGNTIHSETVELNDGADLNSRGVSRDGDQLSFQRPIQYGVERSHSSLRVGSGSPQITVAEESDPEAEFSDRLDVVSPRATTASSSNPDAVRILLRHLDSCSKAS